MMYDDVHYVCTLYLSVCYVWNVGYAVMFGMLRVVFMYVCM